MDRVACKHTPGVGCVDPSKCDTCGWNKETARRRLAAQREKSVKNVKPRTTYFNKITASQETLAKFLASIRVVDAPWDEVFRKTYCVTCSADNCDGNCQHQAERNNPAWFLAQEVADDGNDPLR